MVSADETQTAGLVLRFDLGSINTNPNPDELTGPEIAMLTIYDPMHQTTALDVWRPDEGIFAASN